MTSTKMVLLRKSFPRCAKFSGRPVPYHDFIAQMHKTPTLELTTAFSIRTEKNVILLAQLH